MKPKPLHWGVRAALEFGPLIAFVLVYLMVRDGTYRISGTDYSGFVVVIGAFIPVFVMATGLLWYLTGRVARIQLATAGMLVVFGGLSVWLNDPRFFKMKPTAIYLTLALILMVGLMRGQSWLRYIMEDMIPLEPAGWMILTKRVTAVFMLSAAANELVWRTQSERFWVLFETFAMPVLLIGFFLSQANLMVEYARARPVKKKLPKKKPQSQKP